MVILTDASSETASFTAIKLFAIAATVNGPGLFSESVPMTLPTQSASVSKGVPASAAIVLAPALNVQVSVTVYCAQNSLPSAAGPISAVQTLRCHMSGLPLRLTRQSLTQLLLWAWVLPLMTMFVVPENWPVVSVS